MIDLRIFRYYSDVSRPMHKFIPINLGNSTEATYFFCEVGRVFNKTVIREYSSVFSFYADNVACLHHARCTARPHLLKRAVLSFHFVLQQTISYVIFLVTFERRLQYYI